MVSKVPTIIFGMDLSHGSPGHSDVPSIAAVDDDVLMRETLLDFYSSLGERKPVKIIIFKDGVRESEFNQGSPDNVQPGTVIEKSVYHPRNNDFYLYAHTGMIRTNRPTHYHILLDQVGFSADDLQELVHSLSYVYQMSIIVISVVAPICYTHLVALQLG
ncbi:hypothetical protein F3Y22_tig00113725pilonHSYRG01150 [Hibiscus syriacus]|uniref:Piwi domain-containing protein n=1 Tax=Hibiscus syriacus TaxID=106335 RepID=A0A6A2XHL0_HIBSY|nr:hypothetical protein F3Y22_tig00113725pilonHSYRG01150 [Hibiscus syriacus]